MNVDSILVIDKGRIVEKGTHSELLGRQGMYARIVGRVPEVGPVDDRHKGSTICLNYCKDGWLSQRRGPGILLRERSSPFCLNIALMLPAAFVFLFLEDYLRSVMQSSPCGAQNGLVLSPPGAGLFGGDLGDRPPAVPQQLYQGLRRKRENRRIGLAEKLRKLPLAFFGEKNLSDLTSTIMSDNTELEMTFSHAVPQLFASIITLLLIAIGLFFFNWRLSLALFWVVPVATTVFASVQEMAAKEQQADL